ncbi:MAG TPA: macro domain-containing protein [Armatimonadota bacterium]|jgi:O-acetyl-ADP-ribose deacetylase (regulator of RNase III)
MSDLLAETALGNGARLRLRRGDITDEAVDAVVNAANTHLQHGGGVAGAIVRKGGREIQTESDAVGYTPTGTAAITGAGSLPARFVIHAVGPVWDRQPEGDSDTLLASAVEAALELASARELHSIAFPAISSGIYGFPKDRCAAVMLAAIAAFVDQNPDASLRDIRIVVFDDATAAAFDAAFAERFKAGLN